MFTSSTSIDGYVALDLFQESFTAKDSLVVLIDCSESMFKTLDEESPFQLSMKVSLLCHSLGAKRVSVWMLTTTPMKSSACGYPLLILTDVLYKEKCDSK